MGQQPLLEPGSPPRTRGAVKQTFGRRRRFRFTPAHTGRGSENEGDSDPFRSAPAYTGKSLMAPLATPSAYGPPPRTRGRDHPACLWTPGRTGTHSLTAPSREDQDSKDDDRTDTEVCNRTHLTFSKRIRITKTINSTMTSLSVTGLLLYCKHDGTRNIANVLNAGDN